MHDDKDLLISHACRDGRAVPAAASGYGGIHLNAHRSTEWAGDVHMQIEHTQKSKRAKDHVGVREATVKGRSGLSHAVDVMAPMAARHGDYKYVRQRRGRCRH